MRNYFFHVMFCLVLACAAFAAGCSGIHANVINPAGTPQVTGSHGYTPDQLRDLVRGASSYARSAGKDAALDEFSKKEGMFSRGDLYVYAFTDNGTLIADPYESVRIGENMEDLTDVRGLPVTRIADYTASGGGGFFAYLSPGPAGGMTDNASPDGYVPMLGYAYPAGDGWWVGSGIYFSDLAGSDPVPGPVAEMIYLVKKGAEYGKKNGKGMAFSEISNRSGMFVDEEGHYLYAYDYNGTLLAHPYLPGKIGTNLIGNKDPFGMENIRALADTARAGGGYVIFLWPNPDNNNLIETKIGYVMPVDETWWVGSGVYLDEITGVHTSYPSPLS
jgi:two-component system NarL family sensor kinase